MINLKFKGFLFILGISFFSCSKEKYEAEIPSYITIDNIVLSTNYQVEGSSSSSITDAWVFINDDLTGVYELPVTFPVIKQGNVELKIFGGVKDNGILATRSRYPLYDSHTEPIVLNPGETTTLTPSISYNSEVKFTWLEDFEGASLSFISTAGSDTVIEKVTTDVKEGNYSGRIYLDSDMDFFEATSGAFMNIPIGSPVYLELDFKATEPLLIGLYLDDEQIPFLHLSVKSEWSKIYINLTEVVNSRPNADELKVFFGMQETPSSSFISPNPEILLDNIKLVHY